MRGAMVASRSPKGFSKSTASGIAPANFPRIGVFSQVPRVNPRQRLDSNDTSGVDIAAKAGISTQLFLGGVTLSANRNRLRLSCLGIEHLRTDLLDRPKVNQHDSAIVSATD